MPIEHQSDFFFGARSRSAGSGFSGLLLGKGRLTGCQCFPRGRDVCRAHARNGRGYQAGLGFYSGRRFHVDSNGYRKWGPDGSGATSDWSADAGPRSTLKRGSTRWPIQ